MNTGTAEPSCLGCWMGVGSKLLYRQGCKMSEGMDDMEGCLLSEEVTGKKQGYPKL